MSRNYNRVLLVGVIESETLLRTTTNGTHVTNFTLTTMNKWTNEENVVQNYKKWHHIVCWGKIADQVVNTFKVGDTVLIEGSISYRHYEKDDKKIKVAEIKAVSVTKWEGSLNKIIIIGNVETDVELRRTTNNVSVTNFSISTIDKWKDKNNETQFQKKLHRTVCWGKTAEVAANNIRNGALILIEGAIAYKTYVNKDNIKNNHIAEIKISQLTKWAGPLIEFKNKTGDQNS